MIEGASVLSDAELLETVFAECRCGEVIPSVLASRLLSSFHGLRGVFVAGRSVLEEAGSFDEGLPAVIAAIAEISRRISSEPLERAERVDSSRIVHAHFGPLLALEKRESFHVLLLDSKNGLMAKDRVSQGSLGASLVHPREAFRPAVLAAAAAVIFVHNHPSGDPSPSREDHEVTTRLREAGSLLGIPVLDHVVVAARGYYSFADHGWA
jgi:DNA repair protein RadC